MRLTPEVDLAEDFGLTLEKFRELRRANSWPHVRLGRFDVRFTDAQIAEIVAMQSVAPAKDAPSVATVLEGQTSRSARRSA